MYLSTLYQSKEDEYRGVEGDLDSENPGCDIRLRTGSRWWNLPYVYISAYVCTWVLHVSCRMFLHLCLHPSSDIYMFFVCAMWFIRRNRSLKWFRVCVCVCPRAHEMCPDRIFRYGSDTGRPTWPTTQAGNSAFNTRRDFWYKTKGWRKSGKRGIKR